MKSFMYAIFVFTALGLQANAQTDCQTFRETYFNSENVRGVTVLANAFLIRPSVDTQAQAEAKISSGQKGHIVVFGKDIKMVVEDPDCFTMHELRLSGLRHINLEGKYIIPGLQDFHVHNYGVNLDIPNSPLVNERGERQPHLDYPGVLAMNFRMARAGVTSHLDLMSYNFETRAVRDSQRSGTLSGSPTPTSNIYMAGGVFSIEGGHHGDLNWLVGSQSHTGVRLSKTEIVEQEDPLRRRAALTQVIQSHIDDFNPAALKISYDHNPHRPGSTPVNGMSEQLLHEMIEIAKAIKPSIKVICHVGTWADVQGCTRQGADAVTHLPFTSKKDPAHQVPEGLLEEMKRKDMTVIPTMTVYMEMGFVKPNIFDIQIDKIRVNSCDPADRSCVCVFDICTKTAENGSHNGRRHFFDEPLLKALVPQRLLDTYFSFDDYGGNPWIQWGVEHNQMGYRMENFRKFIEAGVRVVSGTDTMWEGTFFGFSLHRELELMEMTNRLVRAPNRKMTQMEILKTSTSNAHDFLGHKRGKLQPGFKADLVVLSESPLTEIKNTRKIEKVMVNGKIVDISAYNPQILGL